RKNIIHLLGQCLIYLNMHGAVLVNPKADRIAININPLPETVLMNTSFYEPRRIKDITNLALPEKCTNHPEFTQGFDIP
ncbi:hypothetical protein, partial [Streptomyces turgidiscabies]|uniref:hypothetical protein n=1 Tax=Streptomyces turgidiscabies TaxID=85558 RepID=UPI0038F67562